MDNSHLPTLEQIADQHPGWLDEALTPGESAKLVGLPERTLEGYRHRQIGPAYIVLGKRRAYLRRDLILWLYSRRCATSDDGLPEVA